MAVERAVLKEISWRDICPWLVIFRTFGLARSAPVLFLATVGALLTPVGWRLGEMAFVDQACLDRDPDFREVVRQNAQWPGEQRTTSVPDGGGIPTSVRQILITGRLAPTNVEVTFIRFVRPYAALLDVRLDVRQAAYYVFGLLWMLVVWGFFGGAITRMAAMKLGREERIGINEATRFAARKLLAYVTSPLFPLVGVILLGLSILVLGLLMRMDWGVLVAGILWLPALLGGLMIAIFLIGLLFGWPLMWGTISSERDGDAFEAFSRSYSYTFQRPLHYLFYAFLATTFGALGWLLVDRFSEAVIWLTQLAACMGAGVERWDELARLVDDSTNASGVVVYGTFLLELGSGFVRSVATGFGYSFFWCLVTAIYLLLRRDVDQTEFDEVFVEAEDKRYHLPDLGPQEAAAAEPKRSDAEASDQQA